MLKKIGILVLAAIVCGGLWRLVRKPLLFPAIASPDAATLEHLRHVQILRDKWGVPHIFGKSDADAAFGLAYAHAQDDWPLIQGSLAAARGKLGLVLLSKQALVNDYFANLLKISEQLDRDYEKLSPGFRAVLEAYARGANYYAYKHPGEVDSRLLPVRGRDIAAGFAHKVPLMVGFPNYLRAVMENKLNVGDAIPGTARHEPDNKAIVFPGSNEHAVSTAKSADGIVRLNINSHQPWEGPVTWYEAQIVSQEGWNMTGGTFPGGPMILHGHNNYLGWALTVNSPDLVDVYKLEMNPANENEYRFDGKWKALEITEAPLEVDTGLFNITLHRTVFWSVHGPVMKTDNGFFAFRYAGMGRGMFSAEQWFQMNKAKNLTEWKSAMRMQAIPMFNAMYADARNIHYVYNALLPMRKGNHDYKKVLPGSMSETLWNEYLPYDKLPQSENPPSGFLQNCNATPFMATVGPGNPNPAEFPKNMGIDRQQNNRSIRSLELFGQPGKISREDFLKYKFDQRYAKSSPMFIHGIGPLVNKYKPRSADEERGIALLKSWDGNTDADSRAAALAILTWQPVANILEGIDVEPTGDIFVSYTKAVKFLMDHYGKLDVPLGEVQRLRRGKLDLPVGGGPDILNAVHSKIKGKNLVGFQGDSYILVVEFPPTGATSTSIHQYGNVNRPASPHYADQAPLFIRHELKKVLRTREEIKAHLESEYIPGEERK
jgi:acyl-homoserine-lactone acylase